MATQDQIEIINSHGEIRFHTLSGSGITNIGRHPDNDIVIESPVVAPFHAILDHQQKPFRLVALSNSAGPVKVSGQILQPNAPFVLHNWDTIELDGHSLVVMESGAASGAAPTIAPAPLPVPIPAIDPLAPVPTAFGATPTSGASGTGAIPDDFLDMDELDRLLSTLPEDRSDDVIIVNPIAQNGAIDPSHPSALDFQIDVEQSATMQVNVTNGGDLVGEFICEVRGIDPTWVNIAPAIINLNDGGQGSFSIAVTAPRLSSSRAQAYYFSVVVTSPNYPGRMNSIGALLVLKPFYNYAVGDVDPRKQNISFTKRMGQAVIPVTNLGNSPAMFQVAGDDERHAATIEFDSPEQGLKLVGQMQASIQPEQTLAVPIFISPRKRRFVGFGGQDISYTVTVTPLNGEQTTPRSVLAQARNMPFIGPIPIILLVLLLLAGVVFLLTPRIDEFTTDKIVTATGDTFTLTWKTSPFTSLHIEPGVGKVDGPSGSKTLTAADPDITYTLIAETWLTPLYPPFFTSKKDVTLTVNPVLPVIRTFASTAKTANVGDSVTISWAVDKTDRLVLTINGAPETIPPEQMTGSRTFTMETNTTFNLQAFNADSPNGISQSLVVETVTPTATAYPPPVIKSFLVEPQTITLGDEVTLTWEVTGVDKIKISGVENELPAKGSLTVRPATNASYVLEAVTLDGQKVNSAVYNVTVETPPTPTPIPGPPVIEFFKITPAEVALGTPDAKNIQLSWKVTGGITNIQISDPSGKSSGLSSEGTQIVSVDKTTIFVLTAFNGPLTVSQTVQVKVKNPVPKITSLNPTSSSDVGGGSFVLTVNGSGFVKDSKVQWAGSNRSTVYVSGTQLTATILPEDLTAAGLFDVKVVNTTPGGGSSGTVQFTLNNPVPTITSITPGTVTKGLTSLTLYVNGTNFVAGPSGQNGSKINFNGADLATVYISNTQLSAQLTTGQLATPGSFGIKVTNPTPGGGSATSSAPFIINASNLAPTIISFGPPLSPITQLYVGSETQILQVNGTLYVPGSLVKWKGIILPAPSGQTVYQSDTKLTAQVTADKLTSVGTISIKAFNPAPGGGDSPAKTLSIVALPITFALNSSTVQINTAVIAQITVPAVQANDVLITMSSVPGGYVAFYPKVDVDCTILVSGPIKITAGSSSTQLCVKGLVDSSGFSTGINITASLPAALGGQSDSDNLNVISFAPTMTAVSPADTTYAGCAAPGTGVGNLNLKLSIDGDHFVSQSRVYISTNGGGLYTKLSNVPLVNGPGTNLTVNVPSSFTDSVTTLKVQVRTGTFSTAAYDFNILAPTLSSTILCPVSGAGLSPATAVAGAADFTLTVKGGNFVQGSTIYWNGASRPTSFIDHNQLQTTITASDLQSTGTFAVLVKNPNTAFTSTGSINFTVTAPVLTLTPNTASLQVGTSQSITVSLGSSQSLARTVLLSLDISHTGVATITDCSGNAITSVSLAATASPSATFCVVGAVNSSTDATLTAVVQGLSASTDTATVSVSLAPVNAVLSVTNPTVTATEPFTGEDVTLHVAVTAVNPLAGVPTGTVTFKDNGVNLVCASSNPVTLSGGTADCVTSFSSNNLAAHPLTAVYTASGSFSNGTSNTLSLTVQKAATSITVASPTAITYGESATFQAALLVIGGGAPTGTVSIYNDVTSIPGASGTVAAAASPGLSPSPILNAGTYQINAHYNGDNNYAASVTPNQGYVVSQASTSNTLTSSLASPIFYGQAVIFTATIVNTTTYNQAITSPNPTGTVAFKSDGVTLSGCSAKSLSGPSGGTVTATCTTSATGLAVGSHTITAVYTNTDGNFDTTTSGTSTLSGGLTVNPDTTSVSVTTSSATTTYGTSVTFTATVTNTTTTGLTPTGTVTFSGGSPALSCSNTLSGSGSSVSTTCVTSSLVPGTYTITATYDNTDGNFNDGTDTVSQTVNKATTTVSVSASPGSPSFYGQAITFTATVTNTSSSATPGNSGTVKFEDTFSSTTTTLCSAATVTGSGDPVTITCTTSATALAVGTHTITATYTNTNGNFSDSSGTATQLVNKNNTSVSVATSGSPSAYTANVTFTATVTNTTSGETPTGTVDFKSDGVVITGCGGKTISGSGTTATATCSTTALTAGNRVITVIYDNTDGNFSDTPTGTLSGGQTVIDLQLSAPGSSSILVGGGASAASRSSFTVTLVGTSTAQSISLTASSGSVLKFTNCSTTTQITTVNTSGGGPNQATFCAVGVGSGSSTITVTYSTTSDSKTSSSISVSNPTVTLATCPTTSPIIVVGATIPLTVTISATQAANTTVTLNSSLTTIGTVPASVTIIAGALTATFAVTKVANGTTNITATATLPSSLATVSATPNPCNVTFN